MEDIIWIEKLEGGGRMVKRFVLKDFKCKYCVGSNLVLYGKYRDTQQWWCKDCRRKFSGTTSLPKMKSPVTHVGAAVQQYYDGLSENKICQNIETQYNYKPANSTIWRWVEEWGRMDLMDTKVR